MSTYDMAYTKVNSPRTRYTGGWNDICCCEDNEVNPWCGFHGKWKDGYVSEKKSDQDE